MNERINITKEFANQLSDLGLGIVDHITIYKVEGDRYYFTANTGRLHLTHKELLEAKAP
jgi:hypothetical protein